MKTNTNFKGQKYTLILFIDNQLLCRRMFHLKKFGFAPHLIAPYLKV